MSLVRQPFTCLRVEEVQHLAGVAVTEDRVVGKPRSQHRVDLGRIAHGTSPIEPVDLVRFGHARTKPDDEVLPEDACDTVDRDGLPG